MKKLLTAALLLSCIVSCKKDNAQIDEDEFPFYFTATINGAEVNYKANELTSEYSCGISSTESGFGDDLNISEGTVITGPDYFITNTIHVFILKHFDHDPDLSEKMAMFKLGTYPFGSTEGATTVDGATIDYVDANGKEWYSELGPQTGSSFEITELIDNNIGGSLKIFKAAFNCKLYDDTGASIQVNNAVIRGMALDF